jgi:WD40 repeat protein
MGTEQNRETALSKLLTELFDGNGAGLLQWVRLHLGKEIHDELPTGVPLGQLAFETTLAIQRHGLAMQTFAGLSDEWPGQTERIQEVAWLWGGTTAAQGARGPAIPGSTVAGMARLWRVPDLPPHYLTRQATIDAVVHALLDSGGGKVGISAASLGGPGAKSDRHGLHGMGGIGKSVLAAAVARQPAMGERFADGIFWLSVGQDPVLASLQAQLCGALGHTADFDHAADGKQRLREILAEKAVLLVLDDVWTAQHAVMLDVVGSAGCLLVTTRDHAVLTSIAACEHHLDVLEPGESLALLADWTGTPVEALPAEAAEIARACGHLPVALAMIGALVRRRRHWDDMIRLLENARLSKLKANLADYEYHDVFEVIEVSVAALAELDGARARSCYVELAVFPEDIPIPRAALRIAWARHGLDNDDADELAGTLADRALARMDQDGQLTLHDVQRLYALSQVPDLAALHCALADAYLSLHGHANDGGAPYAGLDDGYFFQRVPWHLAQAGRHDVLAGLIFDFDWLDAKLRATSPAELLADLAFLDSEHPAHREAMLVRDAVRLASHVLADDPGQLSSQLVGRLLGFESKHERLGRLLAQVRAGTRHPWLCPLTPTLTAPGGPLVRTFVGHTDGLTAVAVMPSGKQALSASDDKTLMLWDIETGAVLRTFHGHLLAVSAVEVLPGGKYALSASGDRTLKLWEIETGTALRTLRGHSSWVTAVALMPDGKHALSGSDDKTCKLWDLETGTVLATFLGHAARVTAVAVMPGSKQIITASLDSTLNLWELETGAVVRTFYGHSLGVMAVAVMPGGRHALSASLDSTLNLWDLETGMILRTLEGHSNRVKAVVVLPGSKYALSASHDNTLKLWDVTTGKVLRTFEGHSDRVRAVAVIPGSNRALSASLDKTLRLWDLETGAAPRTLKSHLDRVSSVAVVPGGKHAVSASLDTTIKLWDLETGAILRTIGGHAWGVTALAVMPDGRYVLSASLDKTLKLWDLETGMVLRTLQGHSNPVTAVAVVPGAKRALSASLDNTLNLWDLETGAVLRTLQGHTSWVTTVAVMPDGKHALSGSRDQTLKVWNLESGTVLHTFQGHSESIEAVAVMPDGKHALSASQDKMLKVWDLDTGTLLRTLQGHAEKVDAVVVLAGGKNALSASRDNTLKLWDLEAGRAIAAFAGDHPMTACAFAPDTRTVVAGDDGGHIYIFRLLEPC